MFPSVSECWLYPIGRVQAFYLFWMWGFEFLSRYADHFCIWTSKFGFYWIYVVRLPAATMGFNFVDFHQL